MWTTETKWIDWKNWCVDWTITTIWLFDWTVTTILLVDFIRQQIVRLRKQRERRRQHLQVLQLVDVYASRPAVGGGDPCWGGCGRGQWGGGGNPLGQGACKERVGVERGGAKSPSRWTARSGLTGPTQAEVNAVMFIGAACSLTSSSQEFIRASYIHLHRLRVNSALEAYSPFKVMVYEVKVFSAAYQ